MCHRRFCSDDYVGAIAGGLEGDGLADAPAGAGDEQRSSGEFPVCMTK